MIQLKVFSSKPYERPGSYEFIKAAKFGDYKKISNMLRKNPFYVYDYDPANQTALHWAAKRGYTDVAMKLLEHGADPDREELVL
jgi:FOG: Ankyrin repeat